MTVEIPTTSFIAALVDRLLVPVPAPVIEDDDCDCGHPFADHYVTGECRVCDCGDDEDLEEF